MAKEKRNLVQVTPEALENEEAVEVEHAVEEATEVKEVTHTKKAKADNKAPSNVDIIIRQLKKTNDLDKVKRNFLSIKADYSAKPNGEKIITRQIHNVYEMIKAKDPRFAKRCKIDSTTQLVVEVDEIDKEIAKHSKRKTE
jgi:hypothetical protein